MTDKTRTTMNNYKFDLYNEQGEIESFRIIRAETIAKAQSLFNETNKRDYSFYHCHKADVAEQRNGIFARIAERIMSARRGRSITRA